MQTKYSDPQKITLVHFHRNRTSIAYLTCRRFRQWLPDSLLPPTFCSKPRHVIMMATLWRMIIWYSPSLYFFTGLEFSSTWLFGQRQRLYRVFIITWVSSIPVKLVWFRYLSSDDIIIYCNKWEINLNYDEVIGKLKHNEITE